MGADIDVLRRMVQFPALRLMEMEAGALYSPGNDANSLERTNSCGGYCDRARETRTDTVELRAQSAPGGAVRISVCEAVG